jgi:hypothetical protein
MSLAKSPKCIYHIARIGSLGFRKCQSTYVLLTRKRIKTLVGCVSLLQIPRTLIKFWQVYIKPLIITYEQSGKELHDISQPEVFEVSNPQLSFDRRAG